MPARPDRHHPDPWPALMGTAGALGAVALWLARPAPEALARIFLVAAPVRIATGYVDWAEQVRRLRLVGDRVSQWLTLASLLALDSMPSLTLSVAGLYSEDHTRRRLQRSVRGLLPLPTPYAAPAPYTPPAPPRPPVRLYADLQRTRWQLLWWSGTVAAGAWAWTSDLRRALAVMLAGCPSALATAVALAASREMVRWEHRGVLPLHPLAVLAAGEVDTVVFAGAPGRPQAGIPDAAVTALARQGYAVAAAPPATPAAQHVAALQAAGHRVAVVGTAAPAATAMGAAHLAVAATPHPQVLPAAHAVLLAPPAALAGALAQSRRLGRALRYAITASRTLGVAATVATGLGLLGATNALTVANMVGLGCLLLRPLMRRERARDGGPAPGGPHRR